VRFIFAVLSSVNIAIAKILKPFSISDKMGLFFLIRLKLPQIAAVQRAAEDEPITFKIKKICLKNGRESAF
jgi:hypothetical protein